MTQPLEQAGVEAVVKNLSGFLSGIGQMNRAMGETGKQADSFSKQFTNLGSGVLKFGGLLAGAGVAAVGAMTAGFIALGKSALDETIQFEKMEASIQALTARELINSGVTDNFGEALKMAGGKAEETLQWIQKLAIQSPFDSEGVAIAFRTAQTYGFTTQRAKELTEAMINFASATGGTTETMNSVALALGQIQAKGKLSGQEILQLTNAGVGVNKILEDMGFTLGDVEKGLVGSDAFIEAVIKDMNVFGGAAKASSQTWGGLLNSLGDIKNIGLREFFGGIFDAAKPFMVGVVDKLSSPQFMASLSQIGEAIGKAFGFLLQGNIRDAIGTLGIGLQDIIGPKAAVGFINVGVAIDGFLTKIRELGTQVMPYVNQVLAFAREHWEALKGALIGIGAVLAGAAIATIISSIGAAIAAIGAPILALIAAAALLGAAWAEDWGGIRTTLTQVWEDTIKPALAQLWEWLSKNIPIAIDKLSDFWVNVLQPAIKSVWNWLSTVLIPFIRDTLYPWLKDNLTAAIQTLSDFWTNTLQPAITQVWNWLNTVLIPFIRDTLYPWIKDTLTQAIQTLSDYWTNTLKPAIESVWKWIQDNLIPLFETLGELLSVTLTLILTALAKLWNETLLPAIKDVWKFIQDNVIPIFQALADKIEDVLQPVLDTLKTFLSDKLKGAIDGISNAIQTVIGWAQSLIDKFQELIDKMPPIIKPGSPTPFEMGLRGIGKAMEDLARTSLPMFTAQLQLQPVASAGVMMRAQSVNAAPVLSSPTINFNNDISQGIDLALFQQLVTEALRRELP